MATNKNALIRYKILDRCFKNTGRQYFIEDLIAECEKVMLDIDPLSSGISRRQIFDDIAFMESNEGWEIELRKQRKGKKVFYRYVNTSFSINNMPLNVVEVNQLKDAVNILSQFKGMPQFEWVNELIPKLAQGMQAKESLPTIMEFDHNQYLKGIEHLGTLHNAIFYKKVLSISYQPYENPTPFQVILHPYFLKQYNNRWFLFGFNPDKNKYDWNLALDRIVNIMEIKNVYQKNIAIDWQVYFEDIIGVTKPMEETIEDVVLHFTDKTARYIETKPIHGSQKSKWLDNFTLEIRLQVMINYELERLILSYADAVMVVKPMSLRESILKRLNKSVSQY